VIGEWIPTLPERPQPHANDLECRRNEDCEHCSVGVAGSSVVIWIVSVMGDFSAFGVFLLLAQAASASPRVPCLGLLLLS
jgi:hypothetical protein